MYDRFVQRRNPRAEPRADVGAVQRAIEQALTVSGGNYSVRFSRALVRTLHEAVARSFAVRHTLPDHWTFQCFSIAEFRRVFICLQVLAFGWFQARIVAAANGAAAVAYPSAVWTPRKGALITLLRRYADVAPNVVESILDYLTFGALDVGHEDRHADARELLRQRLQRDRLARAGGTRDEAVTGSLMELPRRGNDCVGVTSARRAAEYTTRP